MLTCPLKVRLFGLAMVSPLESNKITDMPSSVIEI